MSIKIDIKKRDLINYLHMLAYFIYPKIKDFYKPILIIIGFCYGVIINKIEFIDIEWRYLFLILFMFDFLIYQARFQLNDIFEFREKKNIDLKEKFCHVGITREKIIFVSSIVIMLRLILFICMIFLIDKVIALNILLCVGLVAFFTVCYEIARAKKTIFPVFFFVCFGYPLRFFAGFLAACKNNFFDIDFNLELFLILLSYAFFGEYGAVLYWLKESILQKEKHRVLYKRHYEFLYNHVKGNLHLENKGKIFDIWNWNFILSILSVSLAILIKIRFEVFMCCLEICFIAFIIFFVLSSKKKLNLIMPVLFLIWLVKIYRSHFFAGEIMFFGIQQFMFVCVYYLLRFSSVLSSKKIKNKN